MSDSLRRLAPTVLKTLHQQARGALAGLLSVDVGSGAVAREQISTLKQSGGDVPVQVH